MNCSANTKCLFSLVVIFLFTIDSSNAQVSTYDKNGNVKSVEQRRYEESQNNQNKYTPKTTPAVNKTEEKSVSQYEPSLSAAQKNIIKQAAKEASWAEAVKQPAFKNKTAKYRYVDNVISKDGLIRVQLNDRFGYINTDAVEVIPVIYENVRTLPDNYYGVQQDNLWGFVNSGGIEMLKPRYNEILRESIPFYGYVTEEELRNPPPRGFVWVVKDDREYQVTKSGEILTATAKWHQKPLDKNVHYDFYRELNEKSGLRSVSVNKKWGCLNVDNKIVIPLKFDSEFNFDSDSICSVQLNGKYGLINKKGEQVMPPAYDEISLFYYSGEAAVKLNDKWGIINTKGKEILAPAYDEQVIFRNYYIAPALQNKKYGYITKEAKVIIPFSYEEAAQFEYSWELKKMFAIIRLHGKYGVIDNQGATVIEPKYDLMSSYIQYNICEVQLDGKFGYVDMSGKEIIKVKYDRVASPPANNFIILGKNGKTTLFDFKGNKL